MLSFYCLVVQLCNTNIIIISATSDKEIFVHEIKGAIRRCWMVFYYEFRCSCITVEDTNLVALIRIYWSNVCQDV